MLKLFRKKTVEKLPPSVLLERGDGRNLYRTKEGHLFWLDPTKYLDKCIVEEGEFEKESTKVVKTLVREGEVVLDVGANIGYYTVILSGLVGVGGLVLAFEPTKHYFTILQKNLTANRIENCKTFNLGLSDKRSEGEIFIGECSATMHWVNTTSPAAREAIPLHSLDEIEEQLKLTRLDFIKLDIDGHEPSFFEGAWKTLDKYNPTVLLEINQENYLKAGHLAWDFYDLLKGKGYKIYKESNLQEFETKREFLLTCANFAYSANVIISRKPL